MTDKPKLPEKIEYTGISFVSLKSGQDLAKIESLDKYISSFIRNQNAIIEFLQTHEQEEVLKKVSDEATKTAIKEVLAEVIANGSADRQSIIILLTTKYKKITGLDFPK